MAKSKRLRKKPNSKPYSGYMKFPLYGAETYGEFRQTCEYFGDFLDPRKRHQIFKKPRKYRMEIWLKVNDGYEVSEMGLPTDGVDKHQLAQILHKFAVEDVKELAERETVYLDQSYFKIII